MYGTDPRRYWHATGLSLSVSIKVSRAMLLLAISSLLLASSCAWAPIHSSLRPLVLRRVSSRSEDGTDDVMQKFEQAWVKQPSFAEAPVVEQVVVETDFVEEFVEESVPVTKENKEETSPTNKEREIVLAAETETEDGRPTLKFSQRVENAKCLFLGTGVGILAVMPFTAFHHFVYQPQYTSIPQWEFDTYMAAIQGALFCLTYRYALRRAEDLPVAIPKAVVSSFIGVRTLSRIHVPMACTPFPLHCE